MNDLDLDLVLDGWPVLEPPAGFAERVFVATAPKRETPNRWPLIGAAAIAAALVIAPFLVPRSHSAPALAHAVDLDAGLRTD